MAFTHSLWLLAVLMASSLHEISGTCSTTIPSSGTNAIQISFFRNSAGGTEGQTCPSACTSAIKTQWYAIADANDACFQWPGHSGENSMRRGQCLTSSSAYTYTQWTDCTCSSSAAGKQKTVYTTKCVVDTPSTLCAMITDYSACSSGSGGDGGGGGAGGGGTTPGGEGAVSSGRPSGGTSSGRPSGGMSGGQPSGGTGERPSSGQATGERPSSGQARPQPGFDTAPPRGTPPPGMTRPPPSNRPDQGGKPADVTGPGTDGWGQAPVSPGDPKWKSFCPFYRDGRSLKVCNNNGECVLPAGANARPECKCNAGGIPPKCITSTMLAGLTEEHKNQAEGMGKVIQYEKQLAQTCQSKTDFLCPTATWVHQGKAGTCQRSAAGCANVTSAANVQAGGPATKCASSSERYCLSTGCISKGAECATRRPCPATTPLRCSDGSCAANMAACPTPVVVCAQQACSDGLRCAKDAADCNQLGAKHDGCAVGLLPCPQSKERPLCVAPADINSKCPDITGCPSGQKRCGTLRSSNGQSKIDRNTGQVQAKCAASCNTKVAAAQGQKPTSTSIAHTQGAKSQQNLMSETGLQLGKISMPSSAKPVGGGSSVNVVVRPVADSDLQFGAFQAVHASGTLMGPAVTIEPDTELDLGGEALEVDLVVVEESAAASPAACALAVSTMAVVSVSDAQDPAAPLLWVGNCGVGEVTSTGCSCKANVTQCCSSFAVVDWQTQLQLDQVNSPSAQGPSSSPSNIEASSACSHLPSAALAAAATLLALMVAL
eukprot:CAMPEP_0114553610 /NCGR_PEP_ID=MMETSP0114-20121206/7756_1 /TAXON_ID=31324 /ORGANISM="Goniomonas sp, Strain m" /LENGTH=772 /DNA_ID=CAMNT_0001738577 /DNA_START=12 /DNA_END=2330 /DNA_ORIENTATION=+